MANPFFNPGDAVEFWDLINRQDWAICERVQLGMQSRVHHFGYYAPAFGLSVVFNLLNLAIVGLLVWRTGGTGRTLVWPTASRVA